MSVFDKYDCEGQMDLFDFIENESTDFCWDEDINEIVKQLKDLAESYGLETGKEEFRIWEHVPHFGYRLWFEIKGTKEQLRNEKFQSDIEKIVDFAKSRKVELTPMWGACWFFKDDDIGRLSFSTLFMDKQRQKRR